MTKSKLVGLTVVAAALGSAGVQAQTAAEGGRPLTASLSGSAEVPGPGDPDGSGMATVTVNPGQERICYTLTVSNIDAATAAHIHVGGSTVAGGVVVTLSAPSDGDSEDCVDVSRELAMNIIRDPSGYYVNVHNPAFPGGAVRGQLSK